MDPDSHCPHTAKAKEVFEFGRIKAAMFFHTVIRASAKLIEEGSSSFGHADHWTLRCPRLTIACSDGKIFLYARSPVAPKKTSASEWELVINFVSFRQVNGFQIQVGCECGFI